MGISAPRPAKPAVPEGALETCSRRRLVRKRLHCSCLPQRRPVAPATRTGSPPVAPATHRWSSLPSPTIQRHIYISRGASYDCMPPRTDQSSAAGRTSGRKSVLFCPDCWHSSPVDGDWRVQAAAGSAVYGCPDCGAIVTTRPTGDANSTQERDSSTTSTTSTSAGGSLFARSVKLAVAWTAWPCTSPDEMTLPPAGSGLAGSPQQSGQHCHP